MTKEIMDGISPLPWVARPIDIGDGELVTNILDKKGVYVTGEVYDHNTDFIIAACNAYLSHVAAIAELVEALESQLVKPASNEASDGPCCSSYSEKDGCWVDEGCTCGNFGDTVNAEAWRNQANTYIEQAPIRALIAKYKAAS